MRQFALVVGLVLLTGGFVTAAGAVSTDGPPRPGSDDSDLDENETATLWSKSPNECLSDGEYYHRYGENRTDLHALETLLESDDDDSPSECSDEEELSFDPSELLLAEIADDADAVVGRFVSLFLSEEPTSTVATSTVYDCYEQWAKQHDIDPDGKSWFARRLGNHIEFNQITERRDGELVRCYEGLKLDHQGIFEE